MKKTFLLLLSAIMILSISTQAQTPFEKRQSQREKEQMVQARNNARAASAKQGLTKDDNSDQGEIYDPFKDLNITYTSITFPYACPVAFTNANSEELDPNENHWFEPETRAMGFSFTLASDGYASFGAYHSTYGVEEQNWAIQYALYNAEGTKIGEGHGTLVQVLPAGTYKMVLIQHPHQIYETRLAFDVQTLNYLPVNAPAIWSADFSNNYNSITDAYGNRVKLYRFGILSDAWVDFSFAELTSYNAELYSSNMQQIKNSLYPAVFLEAGSYYFWLTSYEENQSGTIAVNLSNPPIANIMLPHNDEYIFLPSDINIAGSKTRGFTFSLSKAEVVSFGGDAGSSYNAPYFTLFDGEKAYQITSGTSFTTQLPAGNYYFWAQGDENVTYSIDIKTVDFYTAVTLPHSGVYTIDDETTEIDGAKSLGFRFTTTQPSLFGMNGNITINSQDGWINPPSVILYDEEMNYIDISTTTTYSQTMTSGAFLPAGTYYMQIEMNMYGSSVALSLDMKATGYTPITSFPYQRTVAFDDGNAISRNNYNIKGFTFTLAERKTLKFNCTNLDHMSLSDVDMNNELEYIYSDDNRFITLAAGTYYLHAYQYEGTTTDGQINIEEVVYQAITLPYEQAHTYDGNTLMTNGPRVKLFTFTLAQSSTMNMSDSQNRIWFRIFDADMEQIYLDETAYVLPAGKYYVQAEDYGNDVFTTTIKINTINLTYTPITLPYEQVHTFSASNTVELDYYWIKPFSFTLSSEQTLLFSCSEGYTMLVLYDANMNEINSGEGTLIETLAAGSYRIWVAGPSEYTEYYGYDMTTTVSIGIAPTIDYTEINLPYEQNHIFAASNTTLIGGHKTKFFKFTKTGNQYLNISSSALGAFFTLFDEDMNVEETGYSIGLSEYETGTYYLWVDDRYYSGSGDFNTTLSLKPVEYSLVNIPHNGQVVLNKMYTGFSFTLIERKEISLSFQSANEYIDANLHLFGNGVSNYLKAETTIILNAGTYNLRLESWYEGPYENMTAFPVGTLDIRELNVNSTSVTLPYSAQHTFGSANTELINGNKTKSFTFTLSETDYVYFYSSLSAAYFTLYDEDMYEIGGGYWLTPYLETGTYYLRVDDRGYLGTADLSTTLTFGYTEMPVIHSLSCEITSVTVSASATDAQIRSTLAALSIIGNVNDGVTIAIPNNASAWATNDNGGSYLFAPNTEVAGYAMGQLSLHIYINRTTGIDDVANSGIIIYTTGKDIIIKGIDLPNVEIYDINGRLIARGKNNRFTMPVSGIYLVRVDARIQKVLIR